MAKLSKVTVATIRAQATTKLGINTEKFKAQVKSYLENGDRTIIATLKGKVSERNTDAANADLKYLEDFFA